MRLTAVALRELLGCVEGLDRSPRGCVEGLGKVKDVAAGQGSEAGVQVIEARVNEAQAGDLDVPKCRECAVACTVGAGAMADPEAGSIGGEEGVAFAFERGVAWQIDGVVAGLGEPAPEVRFFALTLGVQEAGHHDIFVTDEACVRGEDHVRPACCGLNQMNLRELREQVVEAMPLRHGASL